eukprot:scaffold105878_cov17-Tisochrysis_lutea.AAC.3
MFRLSYFDCPFCCSTAPLSRSNEGQGFGSLGSVAELSSLSNTKEIGQESSPSSAIDISDAGIQGCKHALDLLWLVSLYCCCARGYCWDGPFLALRLPDDTYLICTVFLQYLYVRVAADI